MKNVFTARELNIPNIPERGDISAWVDCSYSGAFIPSYKCGNCGMFAMFGPSPYCSNCGALMVNYDSTHDIYEKAITEYCKQTKDDSTKEENSDDVP